MRETCPSYVRIRQLVSHSWTWHLSVPLSFSWVICLLLSRINVMCHFTSSTPSKNVIELSVVNLSWSILISQCCQVSCRAALCSRVQILCQPLQYCQPLRQFLLYYSVTPISYDRFRVVDVGFIMALLRRICSCRLQIIIQESNLETNPVPKSLHASMASFFVFVHGLTSLALEWRIPPVFDFKSFIHTCRFVLRHLGNHWHQWWFSSHLLTVYINDQ